MPKAVVVPMGVKTDAGNVFMSYSVALIGPPNVSYNADYQVNTGISVAANFTAWQNKIIADAATRGVTIITADVITFGAPS